MQEVFSHCPYCGERISLLITNDAIGQHYIEDCEVCCRPMTVVVNDSDDETPSVSLLQENDVP